MIKRCEQHGLAFDPALASGCVLCRKASGAPAPPEPDARAVSSGWGVRLKAWGLRLSIFLLLSAVAAVIVYALYRDALIDAHILAPRAVREERLPEGAGPAAAPRPSSLPQATPRGVTAPTPRRTETSDEARSVYDRLRERRIAPPVLEPGGVGVEVLAPLAYTDTESIVAIQRKVLPAALAGNAVAALLARQTMISLGQVPALDHLVPSLLSHKPALETRDEELWLAEVHRKAYAHDPFFLVARGNMYLDGLALPRDQQKAFADFEEAYDLGYKRAAFSKAIAYLRWGESFKAERYLREAGEAGMPQGFVVLADRYIHQLGGYRADEAVALLQKACESGYAPAQVLLSRVYLKGLGGVTQNAGLASQWLSLALKEESNEAYDALTSDFGDASLLYSVWNEALSKPPSGTIPERTVRATWLFDATKGASNEFLAQVAALVPSFQPIPVTEAGAPAALVAARLNRSGAGLDCVRFKPKRESPGFEVAFAMGPNVTDVFIAPNDRSKWNPVLRAWRHGKVPEDYRGIHKIVPARGLLGSDHAVCFRFADKNPGVVHVAVSHWDGRPPAPSDTYTF